MDRPQDCQIVVPSRRCVGPIPLLVFLECVFPTISSFTLYRKHLTMSTIDHSVPMTTEVPEMAPKVDPQTKAITQWDAVLKHALRVSDYKDYAPPELESLASTREKAADLIRTLALLRSELPAEYYLREDDERYPAYLSKVELFQSRTGEIAKQVFSLMSAATDIAAENESIAEDFLSSTDHPAFHFGVCLGSFTRDMDALGIEIPAEVDEPAEL